MLFSVQTQLDEQIKQNAAFLKTEERRAGIYLTEPPADETSDIPALTEAEVWNKVQVSLRASQQQLSRCKTVIQKLHQDCETVAKQNSDIMEHTKECDNKIKSVLSVGRKSAKQNTVPKKTQDLFSNLMDDIEKLVKTRKNVLDKETEGKRHSTRVVRQCRDWIEGRAVALGKLASISAPGAFRSLDIPGDKDAKVTVKRAAPKVADNGIMTILDSLQLLEQELQDYIHKEVTVTDKYRSELRFKHLTKRAQGFNLHGINDVESALTNLEKDPEHMEENLAILRSCIGEINREYSECVSFLNRVVPGEPESSASSDASSSPKSSRRDVVRPGRVVPPSNFKRGNNLGGKLSRSVDNNLQAVGRERSEPNQLLIMLKSLVAKLDELKSEDQVVGNKYRAEMSKRKRDMEITVQRKDDIIMKLETEVKEAIAEKDKYKKLYNDTKIGFHRNIDTGTK